MSDKPPFASRPIRQQRAARLQLLQARCALERAELKLTALHMQDRKTSTRTGLFSGINLWGLLPSLGVVASKGFAGRSGIWGLVKLVSGSQGARNWMVRTIVGVVAATVAKSVGRDHSNKGGLGFRSAVGRTFRSAFIWAAVGSLIAGGVAIRRSLQRSRDQ